MCNTRYLGGQDTRPAVKRPKFMVMSLPGPSSRVTTGDAPHQPPADSATKQTTALPRSRPSRSEAAQRHSAGVTGTASTPTPPRHPERVSIPSAPGRGKKSTLRGRLSGLPRLPYPACSGLGQRQPGRLSGTTSDSRGTKPTLRPRRTKNRPALTSAREREEGRPQSRGRRSRGDSGPAAGPPAPPPPPPPVRGGKSWQLSETGFKSRDPSTEDGPPHLR